MKSGVSIAPQGRPAAASGIRAGLPDLERRRIATNETMNRYRNKPFDWRSGITCVHLARSHLKRMGRRAPTLPRIRSEFAALREMKRRGWANVGEMLDGLLERIPPARMLLGDLAVARSGDGIGSIMICAGNEMLIGWHDHAPHLVAIVVGLDELDGAWRA